MIHQRGKERVAANEVGEEEVLVRAQAGGPLRFPDAVGGRLQGSQLRRVQDLGHDQVPLLLEMLALCWGDQVL